MWISSSQSGYDEKNPLTHNFLRATESEAGKTQSAHLADLPPRQSRGKSCLRPNSCRKLQHLGQTYTQFNSIYSPITTDFILYMCCVHNWGLFPVSPDLISTSNLWESFKRFWVCVPCLNMWRPNSVLGEGRTGRCSKKSNSWKQEKSSAEIKPCPCCPCPQSTEFATQCWGRGRSRVLQGLAQAWWGWHGLAGFCLCIGDGGKHFKMPIKALFFSAKKQQNSVLPLCCWEMWNCRFRQCSTLHCVHLCKDTILRCFHLSLWGVL